MVTTNNTHSSSSSPVPTITYYDAAPTATPTYLNPLPTGTFLVPLGVPDNIYGACLNAVDQKSAWTCDLPKSRSLCVDISEQNGTGRAFLSTCNTPGLPVDLEYGTQPPLLLQQTLKLVTDLDDVGLGPAWHFQTFYDKLAVLREFELGDGALVTKRSAHGDWRWPFSTSAEAARQDSICKLHASNARDIVDGSSRRTVTDYGFRHQESPAR